MLRRTLFLVCTLVGLVAASGSASAATIQVPGDEPTIQDAVDNADPGDTIAVSRKRNDENVTVATNNLKIEGVGKGVTVDANAGGGGDPLNISSNNVSVSNMTFRHEGVDCSGERCSFSKLRFTGELDGACVDFSGDDAKVTRSRLIGCGAEAVIVSATTGVLIANNVAEGTDSACMDVTIDEAVIKDNKIRGCEDGSPIDLGGDDSVISGNSARNTDSVPIVVSGNDNKIIANKAGGAAYKCMDVAGNGNLVKANRLANCDEGLEVSGQDPRVIGNSVKSTFGDDGAYDIDCSVACGDGVVSGNLARDTGNDEPGYEIDIAAGVGTFRVIGNTADRSASEGFDLTIPDGLVRDNLATRNGFEDEDGFDINGAGMRFVGNAAIGNLSTGIDISGSGLEVENNLARGNFGDGIVNGGAGTLLEENAAIGNLGDGIENMGANAEIRRSDARGNVGVDCANTAPGTVAVNQNNDCADDSDFGVPGEV